MKTYEEVLMKWPIILDYIRQNHHISDVYYRTWIEPLKFKDCKNGVIYLSFNENQFCAHIRGRYGEIIEASINAILAEEAEHYMVSIQPENSEESTFFDFARDHFAKVAPLSFLYCKEDYYDSLHP